MAAVWGTEVIQFLAALAILHRDDLTKRINSSFYLYPPGAIYPFLHIIRVKNSWHGKELKKLCPQNSIYDLCLLFGINPSSMTITYLNNMISILPPPPPSYTSICI